MRIIQRITHAALLLFMIVVPATQSTAAELHGRSSTQYLWYNDPIVGKHQKDLSEYLMLSLTGLDSAGKLSLQGYGRAVYDLKDDVYSDDLETRLYYLFVDYRNFMDRADIRLGRQFVNFSSGSSLMDGVLIDVKNIGPVGFMLAGGRDIRFGEIEPITSHASAAGVAVYLAGYKNTDLDVSYFRNYDYSDITRDIVGASFKQYLFDSVKLFADARYDLTAEVFNEVLGGVKYFPVLDLMLTAEYYESYPTFDTTSIYSVFAVEKYQEGVLGAEYTVNSWLDLSAGYYHEEFSDDARGAVYEVGLRLRPFSALTLGVYHDARRGYGGTLDGYKVYAEYGKPGSWKAS
ncbi:MAG TPA: hypothetical protein VN604_12095, partial [Nitrospirota bacterium]|nr:hypothetical protein [Nitrospirota bacterium]